MLINNRTECLLSVHLIQCALCNVLISGRVLTKLNILIFRITVQSSEFCFAVCLTFFFLLVEQLHLYIQIYCPHLFTKEWFWAVPKDCQLLLSMSPHSAGNIQNSHFYFRIIFVFFVGPNFTSSSQKPFFFIIYACFSYLRVIWFWIKFCYQTIFKIKIKSKVVLFIRCIIDDLLRRKFILKKMSRESWKILSGSMQKCYIIGGFQLAAKSHESQWIV